VSGQWEQYVDKATTELELFRPEVERVVALVGPLIAEDTRVRMVAAAGRAVERETAPPFYYCPTSGDIEQTYEGGFTICCDAPLCHEPISPAAVAAAKRVPS
jgi:hypothetical protein